MPARTTAPTFHDPAPNAPDAHEHLSQDILNAFPIPPRGRQHDGRVPVTARLVWEHDGLQLLETTAYAWFGRVVLVEVLDRRRRTHGVWLHVSDVRRR